jgi:hypothetical protein
VALIKTYRRWRFHEGREISESIVRSSRNIPETFLAAKILRQKKRPPSRAALSFQFVKSKIQISCSSPAVNDCRACLAHDFVLESVPPEQPIAPIMSPSSISGIPPRDAKTAERIEGGPAPYAAETDFFFASSASRRSFRSA